MSAYLNGGIALTLSGKRSEALSFFKHGMEIAQNRKDSVFESNFLSNLAFEYADSGDLALGETSVRAALQLSKEAQLKSHVARAAVLLATILEEEGKIDEGISEATQSLTAYQGLTDEHGEATALATLGLLYADKDRVDQAVSNLKRALALHQKIGDIHGQIRVLNNLGIVFSDHGDYASALENEQLALEMAKPDIAA